MNLAWNSLTGPVPFLEAPNLRLVDLGHNGFSGDLTGQFNGFAAAQAVLKPSEEAAEIDGEALLAMPPYRACDRRPARRGNTNVGAPAPPSPPAAATCTPVPPAAA